MTESAPSRRTVGLIVGVALIVVGAVLAAFAVFGGSDGTANPDPTPPPTTSQPTTGPTPGDPSPNPSDPEPTGAPCNVFDPECGGSTTGGTEPTPMPTPSGGSGGNGGGGLFGGATA
ncbi:hypothetical protein [Streptomyces rochei]|uniref:hypothetical protein n=1 Tax=Streptomyces rochei TaxID=1928 RepID=UPI0036FD2E98